MTSFCDVWRPGWSYLPFLDRAVYLTKSLIPGPYCIIEKLISFISVFPMQRKVGALRRLIWPGCTLTLWPLLSTGFVFHFVLIFSFSKTDVLRRLQSPCRPINDWYRDVKIYLPFYRSLQFANSRKLLAIFRGIEFGPTVSGSDLLHKTVFQNALDFRMSSPYATCKVAVLNLDGEKPKWDLNSLEKWARFSKPSV